MEKPLSPAEAERQDKMVTLRRLEIDFLSAQDDYLSALDDGGDVAAARRRYNETGGEYYAFRRYLIWRLPN